MDGIVVLVVGGTGNTGAVAARKFAKLGARVAVSHRDVPAAAAAGLKVVESLPRADHAALVADLSRTATLTALRAEIERRFGRLDVLVNAAGFTKTVPHANLNALDDDL